MVLYALTHAYKIMIGVSTPCKHRAVAPLEAFSNALSMCGPDFKNIRLGTESGNGPGHHKSLNKAHTNERAREAERNNERKKHLQNRHGIS